MLRGLFEGIEKSMGPDLEGLASFAWTFGLLLVALQVLSPFARVALELMLSRAGLEQAWVVACATCGTRSPVGGECLKCGAVLRVSAVARLFARNRKRSPVVRTMRWGASLLGAIAFLACSLWLVGKLAPTGALERVFAGAALVAWAGVGLFLSRALGSRGGGPLARTRELCFAIAACGVLSAAMFLQQTVHPVPERVLVHVIASADSVDLDGAKLAITAPELGLELQVVDHPGLGLGRVLPLAWVGATRSPIELTGTEAWLRDTTWKNAQTLMAAGAQVKRRTETFPIAPGGKYDVVLREREVLLRPAR